MENIFLDSQRGRVLLVLRQPHEKRTDKDNKDAHRIFFRSIKPKLDGFGADPLKVRLFVLVCCMVCVLCGNVVSCGV